ncbi:MAG: outer membrane beta-barrel protein [Bacteroidales bacterium]|nr:outer membrane beta-barrel protein [Bacteroidales bacterium]
MKYGIKLFLTLVLVMASAVVSYAQNKITVKLQEKGADIPVAYATVTLTKQGASTPSYAALSNDKGGAVIANVKNGNYIVKAELLGYKEYTKNIKVSGALDLGTFAMDQDTQAIDAATVSAAGNPIIVKKDTIEFNASSFKTTDNDVLEDLLKKLPGVEVSEDGSVTVNGETVKKITIDGKTFFLDDPTLASKNIPAKMVEKLKVIEKKSEQAEFTGIDDGEEETVIDLSVKPGMMKGFIGSVTGGGGIDLPSGGVKPDARYQAAGFVGKFESKTQISVIFNGNNTNNRSFSDLSGSMMGGMMGGGGRMGGGQGGWGNGNGITSSYMAGANGAWDLCDDRMKLGGNYLFNFTENNVIETTTKDTYLDDYTLNYNSDGTSLTGSAGHRFGIRLDHKFSENTSILFEPQINFGHGYYNQASTTSTRRDGSLVNDAVVDNIGANKNLSTSGFFLFRQRLGIPGRTLTANVRYSYSDNDLLGQNRNITTSYENGNDDRKVIEQKFDNRQNSSSVSGRLTYTEPLGNHFYLEANYSYSWSRSTSNKLTRDLNTGEILDSYSNAVRNEANNQNMGANFLYQKDKLRAQVGFAAMPTRTVNTTTAAGNTIEYDDFRWNFSPRVMLRGDFTENSNGRLNYRGTTSQPSTSQLMPVPDVTDPLNIRFGNPSLTPYFTHSLNGDYRYNNKKNFFSFNVRFNGRMVQNPIVSALWYGANGAQYTMPVNGRNSGSAGLNYFINAPIGKSGFTISNQGRGNWSTSSPYVGSNVDMSRYPDPTEDYYGFMNAFLADHKDLEKCEDFKLNTLQSVSFSERIRFIYRTDDLELSLGGNTRMNKSWYTISTEADNTTTWNNQIRAAVNWTWSLAGLTLKADYNYNWYNGYKTAQPSEHVLNAEIQKLLCKNKLTLALKGYDILGQAKNLTVSDASNYHQESVNNTLGRYIILSLTYRFGTFNRNSMMRGGGPGPGMGGHGPR